MRRLIVAIASIVLLGVVTTSPVLASHSGYCQQFPKGGGKAGVVTDHTGTPTGVEVHNFVAVPNPGRPDPCTHVGDSNDIYTATSFWVGMQEPSGLGIIQLGILDCADNGSYTNTGPSPCDPAYRGTWRYFYAFGGCNFNVPWARDLGSATVGSPHTYRINWNSSVINFWIDGSLKASIAYGQMACWDNSGSYSILSCETFDLGDSCGGSGSDPVRFNAYQWLSGGVWHHGNLSGARFNTDARYHSQNICGTYCDALNIWTVQP